MTSKRFLSTIEQTNEEGKMLNLLRRLTNLSIVSSVLQEPASYPNVHYGFERDRRNLCKNCNEVVKGLNHNVSRYGKEYTD